jgi:glycosyltransferase involved in cell wall biosynthesis
MSRFTGTLIQVHYHDRPGGVATVMGHFSAAFSGLCGNSPGKRLVLCRKTGASGVTWQGTRIIDIKECDYRLFGSRTAFLSTRDRLAASLARAIASADTARPVYVVGHNLTLGKNCALSSAFALCARRMVGRSGRIRFFSVIHDFAEEGRAALMAQIRFIRDLGIDIDNDLYPLLPNFHFVALNRRNRSLLNRAGFSAAFIPTPMGIVEIKKTHPASGRSAMLKSLYAIARKEKIFISRRLPVVLYPSRIISRKNPLEAILLGQCVFHANLLLGSSGRSRPDRLLTDACKRLCAAHRLPIVFDCGRISLRPAQGTDEYSLLYHVADVCLSTSVAEGFGYGLHEPRMHGKAVIGRLPLGIGEESAPDGSWLYKRLLIPCAWIDVETLKRKYHRTMLRCFGDEPLLREYGFFSKKFDACFIRGGGIDYGCLDAAGQYEVLAGLLQNPEMIEKWRKAFPCQFAALQGAFSMARQGMSRRGALNRRRPVAALSQESFVNALGRCLSQKARPAGSRPDRALVRRYFCSLKRFRLLQSPDIP